MEAMEHDYDPSVTKIIVWTQTTMVEQVLHHAKTETSRAKIVYSGNPFTRSGIRMGLCSSMLW